MAAPAPEQASSGLPQFDLSQWPGQMVWMAAIFAVMLIVFYWFVVPRLGGTMAAREDRISGDIGAARRLRDEAQAQSDAAQAGLGEAEARISAARTAAMGEVRGIAAEAAVAIVVKLTGQPPSAAEVEHALA